MAAIARELGQVLKAPAAEILGRSPVRVETAGLPIIDHQLDRLEHVYRVTTESLMRLPSSAKVPVFEDVVLGNYPLDAQLWAVIGELEAGDYSHLALAIPSAIQPSSDVGPLTHGYLLDAIDGHKPADDRDATLRFIATAMPLLEATDVEVRRIGARVLRRTRDEKSIHPLMQALNDEDLEVRYNAVAGLSEIVNPIDTPTYEQFVAAESRYLSIWKNYRP